MTKDNEYCANKNGIEAKIQVGHSNSQEPHKAVVAELKRRFKIVVEFVFNKPSALKQCLFYKQGFPIIKKIIKKGGISSVLLSAYGTNQSGWEIFISNHGIFFFKCSVTQCY